MGMHPHRMRDGIVQKLAQHPMKMERKNHYASLRDSRSNLLDMGTAARLQVLVAHVKCCHGVSYNL